MVEFCINGSKNKPKSIFRGDWRHYSGGILNLKLSQVNWEVDIDDVQGFWNDFESKVIQIVDEIVLLMEFTLNLIVEIKLLKIK